MPEKGQFGLILIDKALFRSAKREMSIELIILGNNLDCPLFDLSYHKL